VNKRMLGIVVAVILVALTVLSLLVYNYKSKSATSAGTGEPVAATAQAYGEQDIHDAMAIVRELFQRNFKGCTLTDLWYDADVSVPESDIWAKQYDADEAILLLSNFDVDSSGGDGSLNPNSTYSNWEWILVRNKGQAWELKTWGY